VSKNAFWGDLPRRQDGSWLHRHSLQVFLIALTAAQTLAALWLYWLVWKQGWDKDSGKVEDWTFAAFFGAVYLTSIVADSYGAWLQVFATAHFIDEKSPESK
jgi:hypothetical protein